VTGSGAPPGPPDHIVHHLEKVMGTIMVIDVYADADRAPEPPGGELGGQLDEAVAILHRADAIFSTWRTDSPVSRLRRGEITSAQAPLR
jgi:thiamine biosynthesis lipoprotein